MANNISEEMIREIKIYNVEELSEVLGVSTRTLYRYIKDDKIKASKIGAKWTVTHKDLKSFIENR